MGRRLDNAYAEGKFTTDEYNELNAGLGDLTVYLKGKYDNFRAQMELHKNKWGHDNPHIMTGDKERDRQTLTDHYDRRNKAIEDILNRKNFVTDINVIIDMINKLRYRANSIV